MVLNVMKMIPELKEFTKLLGETVKEIKDHAVDGCEKCNKILEKFRAFSEESALGSLIEKEVAEKELEKEKKKDG